VGRYTNPVSSPVKICTLCRIGNEIRQLACEICPESYPAIRYELPSKILRNLVATLQAKERAKQTQRV
jgi:hypothetical protein